MSAWVNTSRSNTCMCGSKRFEKNKSAINPKAKIYICKRCGRIYLVKNGVMKQI